MFAVGDPKQSIYGFRGADVALFSSLLAADPSSEELTVNRRTRTDVCEWINVVLAHRFEQPDDSAELEHQVPFTALEAQRPANPVGGGPAVVVLGMPGAIPLQHVRLRNRAGRGRRHRRARERVVGTDPWPVADDDGERPASYRDIRRWIRSRTRLGVLEHPCGRRRSVSSRAAR
jgi:hypothetical protein